MSWSTVGYVLAGLCVLGSVFWVIDGEWIWAGVLLVCAVANFYYAGVNRKAGL